MNRRALVIVGLILAVSAVYVSRRAFGKRQAGSPTSGEMTSPVATVSRSDPSEATARNTPPPDAAPTEARPQLDRLAAAVKTARDSTLLAFTVCEQETDYDVHDAQALNDSERLQQLFSSIGPDLTTETAEACGAFVDRIASAQLAIMSFAINRKNRGLPDEAQVEAELADRDAFKKDAEPLYSRFKAALEADGVTLE